MAKLLDEGIDAMMKENEDFATQSGKETMKNIEPTEKPKQKRYYGVAELIRKFGLYLKKTTPLSNLGVCSRRAYSVRLYFDWLKSKSLTIYTAKQEDIKSFYKQLCSVLSFRGKGLSKVTLSYRRKDLHIFYQWLYQEKLIEENVFNDALFLETTMLIRNRDAPKTVPPIIDRVPEAFKDIYELAEKMDRQRGYHKSTINTHKWSWRLFFNWLNSANISDIAQAQERELILYQHYLIESKNVQKDKPYTDLKRLKLLCSIKLLFEYLRLNLIIKHDPTHVIELPKYGGGIPHVLLTRHEVEKMFQLADISTPLGIRDRAILESFYSTGVRNNELCNLKLEDILFHEGMIRVMVPKGGVSKQRVIPIGDVALHWVRKYLNEARTFLMGKQKHDYIFVNLKGAPLRKWNVMQFIKSYRYKAGFKKHVTSHCFRVTVATEMLRNRADIRYVQAQLGHSSLQSTQVYTRVLPGDLKKVHQRTHPRERGRYQKQQEEKN